MSKRIFVILLATFLLVGCGSSTKSEPVPAIIISDGLEQEGTFDGKVVNGYASGYGSFYSTNSSGKSYVLTATFENGYINGDSELLFDEGSHVQGHYTMGQKDGIFTIYVVDYAEYTETFKDGKDLKEVEYLRISDNVIYEVADKLLKSDDNPANWPDSVFGLDKIDELSLDKDKAKQLMLNRNNKIREFEDEVFESIAQCYGITQEEAEMAYTRAAMGEDLQFTEITK